MFESGKKSFVDDIIESVWRGVKKHIKKHGTFNSDTPRRELMRLNTKGVYILMPVGKEVKKGDVLYVGKAVGSSGIGGRLYNHARSLREPSWPTEKTGKTFRSKRVDPFQDMDIHYIDANDIGIRNSLMAEMIEEALQEYLDPIAFDKR